MTPPATTGSGVLQDKIRENQQRSPAPGSPRGAAAASVASAVGDRRSRCCSASQGRPQTLRRSPPVLSLALGSAYFRSGQLADAEREYRAALDVKPKLGRAAQQPRGRAAPHRPARRRQGAARGWRRRTASRSRPGSSRTSTPPSPASNGPALTSGAGGDPSNWIRGSAIRRVGSWARVRLRFALLQ